MKAEARKIAAEVFTAYGFIAYSSKLRYSKQRDRMKVQVKGSISDRMRERIRNVRCILDVKYQRVKRKNGKD
jgi:hypothetical protein